MTSGNPFVPSGVTVGVVAPLCKAQSAEAFRASFGAHFILQRGEFARDERENWKRFATITIDKNGVDDAVGAPKPTTLVYAVPRAGKPPFPSWVTVGRAKTNLIVIEHGSISKLHGLFVPEGLDRFFVCDARSTNGTAVNGRPASRFGEGEQLEVKSGDRVRFGATHFLFLDSNALWTLMHDV